MEQIKLKDLQKYKIGEDGIKVYSRQPHIGDGNGIFTITCLYEHYCDILNFYDDDHVCVRYNEIRPILRPLTDLYEPMENGEIHIVELAKIAFPHAKEYELIETDDLADEYCVEIVGYTDFDIAFWCSHYSQYCDFISSNADNFFDYFLINNQLQLLDWLYEHHFWLGDQSYFDKGLIIDKNNLGL